MGDRRMAELRTRQGSLYVYTHNHGDLFPAMTDAAVAAAQTRWTDPSYALRILVDQLTKPGRDKPTGFGLMLTPDAEDEYNDDKPSIIVDLRTGTTTVIDHGKTSTEHWRMKEAS